MFIFFSDSYEEKQYSLISFDLEKNTLRSLNQYLESELPPNLGSVTVLGVQKPVKEVYINGKLAHSFKFDTVHKVRFIKNLYKTLFIIFFYSSTSLLTI